MFRDLRAPVSSQRQLLAKILFFALLAASGLWLFRGGDDMPWLKKVSEIIFDVLLAITAIRVLAYFFLDPLLRQRKTDTPGFSRDLIVVLLYIVAGWIILKDVLGVSVGQLLGTGAIAAAVIGLSLQETLGNLFAGIAMHLDPAFQVGDWVEVSGNLRGGQGRETFVGEVVGQTWRTVQLRTENGDTDVFPNRAIALAVVTNLYAPSGLHRRTAKLVVVPSPHLHEAIAKLNTALGGIPHYTHHRPEVVTWGSEMGGAVLELRWWALGFRHGRAGHFQAMRLAHSVLPREGFPLLGFQGATTPIQPKREIHATELETLLDKLQMPKSWAKEFLPLVHLRITVPEEGVIREGEQGASLFYVIKGELRVVRPVERSEPYTGLYWEEMAIIHAGEWFGEASLLTGAPRNATVISGGEGELLEVPKLAFERLLEKDPRLLDRFADLLERRKTLPEAPGDLQPEGLREQWLRQIRQWFQI